MKATISRKEISYGNVTYRTNGSEWEVLMFGTYGPSCNGIPSHRFMPIPAAKVPKEVQLKGGEE